ncbi:cyclic nucleotide-binding domain-containing protein [candidate division KSB1 bacterium]|nr:cyclic nucleotide-binding domain-containing protein [candidate division KSB1 bacterium]
MQLQSALKDLWFFSSLDVDELEKLSRICEWKTFIKNEKIFDQNDTGDSLFILVEGRVVIERRLRGYKPAIPKQLVTVKKGQPFGEMAFIENRERSATARAKGHVKVICIYANKFFNLIEKEPVLGLKMMTLLARVLGRRLRRTNDQWLSTMTQASWLLHMEYQE